LAKIASDHRKPDGLFVITPKMGPAFVENPPVDKFHGVGPATAAKMNALGIPYIRRTCNADGGDANSYVYHTTRSRFDG
jgi:nucleotidyltransferase/DNA polymerase involved in DNA repair